MARQVFEGIKVADFAWAGVGPMVGRELAEHGAIVVRIESHRRMCSLRTMGPFPEGKTGVNCSAMFATYNTQKYGMTLDMSHPGAGVVTRRLVEWADVISDSMAPGVMAKWGLDYESCRNLNPAVIYFSTTQQGQDGPYSNFHGYGHHANAIFGACEYTGWPDSEPTLPFTAYSDFIAPWYLTTAVIGALIRRNKTGEGMYIEQSQLEAGLSFMGVHVLDYMVNERIGTRMGNRDRYMCPHGIYPCRGMNRWIAIAITDDKQWVSFCQVARNPEWSTDSRFTTTLARKKNEDELDRLIGEWTKDYTAEQVMAMLQDAGVPAGVVQNGEDLLNDPQLKCQEHYRVLKHPEIGPHSYNAPAYRFSKTPCYIERPAPCIGQDNGYVYKDLLHFTEDEIADLIAEGVITTDADL